MREVDRLINSGHCAVSMLNGEWRGGGGGGGALSGTWKDVWFEVATRLVVHRLRREVSGFARVFSLDSMDGVSKVFAQTCSR